MFKPGDIVRIKKRNDSLFAQAWGGLLAEVKRVGSLGIELTTLEPSANYAKGEYLLTSEEWLELVKPGELHQLKELSKWF